MIQLLTMEPFIGVVLVDPGLDSLFVNKNQDIDPIENKFVGNTCEADEVSPKISYGDSQN